MIVSFFLHIYQPENQFDDVLDRIVNESYRPIFRFLNDNPKATLTFNISGVLLELWDKKGYRDLIDTVNTLLKRGQIELTGTAKYHAFLPLIPKSEVERQVMLNFETSKFYFGEFYKPQGFFAPEMSYSPKIAEVAKSFGYKYIVADQIAFNGSLESNPFNSIASIGGVGVDIYFRHKNLSNLIMGANFQNTKLLISAISNYEKEIDNNNQGYALLAMDGETFGHHRVGLENTLFGALTSKKLITVKVQDIKKHISSVREVVPVDSTWASSQKELEEGTPFKLWFNPDNQIHKLQWELTDLAIYVVNEAKSRTLLDSALYSCHYWWASANPWWSIEMIEKGAYGLYLSITASNKASIKTKERALELYQQIITTAFSWQRTGYVREIAKNTSSWKKIPFSIRGKKGEMEALLDLLLQQEKQCIKKREYEQAIRWRDAQYKLKNNLDIYDAVHVIDQLRTTEIFKKYPALVNKYASKLNKISSGQPEK